MGSALQPPFAKATVVVAVSGHDASPNGTRHQSAIFVAMGSVFGAVGIFMTILEFARPSHDVILRMFGPMQILYGIAFVGVGIWLRERARRVQSRDVRPPGV
jgi:hypothetical protein